MSAPPLRIAHRGMPRRLRENTLPSFAAAIAAGAQGIELDVHATADDVVVVHHDAILRGSEIRRTQWSALSARELAAGVRAPTLREVCQLVSGSVELFVEVKGAGIEVLVVEAMKDYEGTAAIHSFDHAMIGRLARLDVPHRLGLLFEDDATHARNSMRELGALDVWPHHSLVTERLIDDVHAAGGRVIPWTVNDAVLARGLASLGVDGLCTDDVTILDAV
ncbi:MAG: glycerophosphoryl diester phosphodiesterase [Gemmatimonadetes bacterium]|nr:glycerophosphoryl diester phosphodiesterase [Gemmatimonadota bacterium]